jgi:hypothetical protein
MAETSTYKKVGSSTLSPTENRTRKQVLVKQPVIVAEIMEVSWKSGIDMAREKTKIVAPHWRRGEKLEEDDKADEQKYATGSRRPGVYLVKSAKGMDTFIVKLNITKNTSDITSGKLVGNLGKLNFEGTCSLAPGLVEVTMKIKDLPDTMEHIEGDASWRIETTEMQIALPEKTRLELFVVLAKPMSFYTQGVWAEALRFVFKKAKVASSPKPEEAAKKITTYCHTGHGMRYDILQGGSHFNSGGIGVGSPMVDGGFFQLMKYMCWPTFPLNAKDSAYGELKNNVVNCYDQAAAVHTLCGSLGIKMMWVFAYPYGFIKTANLVGVGQCNNPFTKSPGNNGKKISGPLEAGRDPFGNHAFAQFNDKNGNVHDACSGPHVGTENILQYLNNGIDAETSILIDQFRSTIKIQTGKEPKTAAEYIDLIASDRLLKRTTEAVLGVA